MDLLLLFLTIIILALLLGWIIRLGNSSGKGKSKTSNRPNSLHNTGSASTGGQSPLPNLCPLCQSQLGKGQDLISRVYRPMDCHDQLCTINGCPNCYPSVAPGLKRICPVCHKEVDVKDGHLVARLFNHTENKKHVIVTGCNKCCRGVR